MPTCRICRSKFTSRFSSFQKTCENPSCIIEWSKQQREKVVKKEWSKEKKKIKESHITPSQRLSKLEDEINHIARLIDKGHGCTSCEAPPKKINGGHLRSVGSSRNIRYKGGNTTAYCDKLIRIFGKERFEYCFFDLMRLYPRLSPSTDQIIEWTKIARKIVARLKSADEVYTTDQRWTIREEINQELGIYK